MKSVNITNGIMKIDTRTETFNMQEIQKRRFLYNPQTGVLILGIQTQCNDFFYKKAAEYRRIGIRSDFNEFVSGWVGNGKTGVIDFTPTVPTAAKSICNRALDTLVMFYRNNANMKTEIRGFGNTKPQPLENIITEREVELMAQAQAQATKAPEKTESAKTSVQAIELSGGTPYEKLSEIMKKLEDGVKDIFNSGKYAEYLACMSKFHNYSFRNTLLILMQKPDASMVAGFGAWRDNHKRTVKRGERGIKIIAPSSYKTKKLFEKINPATNEPFIGWDNKPLMEEREITIPTFRVATVFDVSQTEGEPLPQLGVDELTGKVADFKDFYAALEKLSPVPIGFEDIDSGAKGYFNHEENRIAVNNGMSDVQTLKTLIHEIAHAKLHNYDIADKSEQDEQKDRNTREVEAESVAYVVCQRYGIETSDYSFGYVAGWSKDKELPELNASLDTIQKTANEIISGIDEYYKELTKDIEQTEQETDYTQYTGWEFNGGHTAINTDANYLQVFFDEKPDDNIRAELKSNGFRWAPKISAWQQPLTDEVLAVADKVECIRPLDGTLPSELQGQNAEPAQTTEQDGFSELSDAEAAEGAKVFEQTDNSADTPTIAELEEKAKNGEPIAIMDMIAANEAEKASKAPPLTANEKEIKNAVMDVLKERIAYANDGTLSTYKANNHSHTVMNRYNVKIEDKTVTKDGKPLFEIERRYSSKKTKGCYRELNPVLKYVQAEQKQEKPSIKKQLAEAKEQAAAQAKKSDKVKNAALEV